MKQLTVVKGHSIGRGFRICCTEVMTAINPLSVGILATFTFTSTIFHLVPLLLQASSHLVPLLLQASHPSCSFTFASIIPSCFFTFSRVIPTTFTFLLKLFYFTCNYSGNLV